MVSRGIPATPRLDPPVERGGGNVFAALTLATVASIVFVLGFRVLQYFGLEGLTVFTGIVLAFVILAVISVRYLEIAVLVWIIALSGFRSLVIVNLPGMPDVTLDRILFVWVAGVTALRSV